MKEHLESSIFGDQDDPHGTASGGATREPAPTYLGGSLREAERWPPAAWEAVRSPLRLAKPRS